MPRNPDIPRVNEQTLRCLDAESETVERIKLDTERWFEWLELEETRSFAFEGYSGRFTARKENKKRGNAYWYAYRWLDGKTIKAYLGASQNLTLDKLDEVAAKLARRQLPLPFSKKNGTQNGQHPQKTTNVTKGG